MDYSFFTKPVGILPNTMLSPLIERAHEMYKLDTSVARFNVRVRGHAFGQDPESDKIVSGIQKLINSWDIPSLFGNTLFPYYTVNWIEKNGSLHEHTDIANGHSFDDLWNHKLHVPLVTNPGSKTCFRRTLNDPHTEVHLEAGKVYMYNTLCLHKVENPGEARAHLIMYARDQRLFDYYKTTKIFNLLSKS
jgi:hypothetical protein